MQLVVLVFGDRRAAEQVFELTEQLAKQDLLPLEDVAWVERRPEGGTKLHQSMHVVGAGGVAGAMWGTLAGLLFMRSGSEGVTGAGTVSGSLADVGLDDGFVRDVGASLCAGGGSVLVLVRADSVDALTDALRPYQPRVIQATLRAEDEQDLVRALKV